MTDDPQLRTNIRFLQENNIMNNDYTPPDSYAALAKLRAEASTPESRFEDEYKAARQRALDEECAQLAAHVAATPLPRLTAAELAKYAAPDGWTAALRQEEKR